MGCLIKVLICVCFHLTIAQAQESGAATSEACNINVACQCAKDSEKHAGTQKPALLGAPGKKGPKGEVGPIGLKGDKGDVGKKGEKGKDNDAELKAAILRALGAKSCDDLPAEHGFTAPGYYLMQDVATKRPAYKFCDFQIYKGVYTCHHLKSRYNVTKTGYYYIGGEKPFRVHCNFASGTAVTEALHDLMYEMRIPDCEKPGCYTGAPLYETDVANLKKVIENSVSCRQFMKLRCQGVLVQRNGYTWWTSRDGEKMKYWGGAKRDGYCACGEKNNCINKSYKCNCDQNSGSVMTSDEGYLTDKSKLPLKEMRVGDMGNENEMAWHTVGKLECRGQV